MKLNEINTVEELEDCLSIPNQRDVETAREIDGDVLVLGAAGKMGPTLVRRILRARGRAGKKWRVYANSRFSDPRLRDRLESWGATTLAGDALEGDFLKGLPRCPYVLHLIGFKFGATGNESLMWATNSHLPGRVAETFRDSRIVALSTGNVYPLVGVGSGGSREEDPLGPIGECAQSCLGRERVLHHFSATHRTPICILRLNYAAEARYGVLLDIATRIHQGFPVALEMGYFNVIWQGDANSVCFRSLLNCQSPPLVLNVTGREINSVREIAGRFAEIFGVEAKFEGREGKTALLSDSSRCRRLLGDPEVSLSEIIELVARWVRAGNPTLGKPTRFEVRDGKF